ncbi:MAG TPA: hypothetical protein PKL88_02050 [bacterium]|nr:hypothetical protein [bacterium]
MTKKELAIKVERLGDEVNNLSLRIDKLVKSDRLQEVINLLLDHLKLQVKEEDYIDTVHIFGIGDKKVVKTRQVLVAKEPSLKDILKDFKWEACVSSSGSGEPEKPTVKPKRKYTKRKKK